MAERWGAGVLDGSIGVLLARDVLGLIGFVAFDLADPAGVHVDALHVAYGRHGFGIGSALLRAVAALATSRPVWLEVLEGNSWARLIYAHWDGAEGPTFAVTILCAPVVVRKVTWADSAAWAARRGGSPRR